MTNEIETIDCTPTWAEILPTWLMLYRQAITGDCTNPTLVRENAEKEFRRMAEAADKWNAHCKKKNAARKKKEWEL
jgi:hypothetical protein